MAPLAKWCNADYYEKRVKMVVGKENRIEFEDGTSLEYDVLVLNVGSRTAGADKVPGIWENSLTTRPINDLLPKIVKKEASLKEQGIIPKVVVCGAGAAGTELAFAFKKRWSAVFEQDIELTLLSNKSTVLAGSHESVIKQVTRKLEEHKIDVIYDGTVASIESTGVVLTDGRKLECNVPIWATGAEAQKVSADSDLELMNGFFRVNDFLQSVTFPNVFGGGDCITIESTAHENFPPKAGVYAVRAGPFIARNVMHFLSKEPLEAYIPQREFLSLLMLGNGKAVGTKFGITFVGKWVWGMKDFIDLSFMHLFDARRLFEDYDNLGTQKPTDHNGLFDDEDEKTASVIGSLRVKVSTMDPETAAKLLGCSEEDEDFHERFLII